MCFSEVGWCFCSQAVACVNPCSLSLSNSLAYSIDDCCNSLASSLNPALGDKFTLRFASDRSRPDPQDAFDALLDHPAITRRCYPRVAGALPGVANLLSLYSTGVHAQVGRSTLTPFLPKESYSPKRQIQRYLSATSFKPSFDFVQTIVRLRSNQNDDMFDGIQRQQETQWLWRRKAGMSSSSVSAGSA